MSAEVTLDERMTTLREAERNLGELAEEWLEARAAGNLKQVFRLNTGLDAAQQRVKRAARNLVETQKRLARKQRT